MEHEDFLEIVPILWHGQISLQIFDDGVKYGRVITITNINQSVHDWQPKISFRSSKSKWWLEGVITTIVLGTMNIVFL